MNKKDNEARIARMRGIVRTMDHQRALLCFRALNAFATVLTVADATFPDPEKRQMAADAVTLATEFREANAMRDFLTERDGS